MYFPDKNKKWMPPDPQERTHSLIIQLYLKPCSLFCSCLVEAVQIEIYFFSFRFRLLLFS